MSGVCSRRQADEFIEQGRVKINDEVITSLGSKVNPRYDKVELDGNPLAPEKPVYILLNKPKNTITTMMDPEGRKTVMDLVRELRYARIFPVGRLDRDTTGILLLTNDGPLAKMLTHPSYEIRKIYRVTLNRNLTEQDIEKLKAGVMLEDGLAKADKIGFDEGAESRKEVLVEIHSGKNRVIRRMFDHLGYSVVGLDRTAFGPIDKKGVERGHWRHLTASELNFLKMAASNRLARKAAESTDGLPPEINKSFALARLRRKSVGFKRRK